MKSYENLEKIDRLINSHEKQIRYWALINHYKVIKNPKLGCHLILQKYNITNTIYQKTGRTWCNYEEPIKVKISLSKNYNLHSYVKDVVEGAIDQIWIWNEDNNWCRMVSVAKLKEYYTTTIKEESFFGIDTYTGLIIDEDAIGKFFSKMAIEMSVIDKYQFTDVPKSFTYTESFPKYKLSYYNIQQHNDGIVYTIKLKDDYTFSTEATEWKY